MEFTLDYGSLAKKLERLELESSGSGASPQVYGQLLAIYLLFNDKISAKFLWKRIPDHIKAENNELSLIWQVGKLMWKKNYSEIYATINSCPVWPNHLKNIMKLIVDTTRKRVINLISAGYHNIKIEDVSKLLGQTEEETIQKLESGWIYNSDTRDITIMTKRDKTDQLGHLNANIGTDLLTKLTDYIVFLESDK